MKLTNIFILKSLSSVINNINVNTKDKQNCKIEVTSKSPILNKIRLRKILKLYMDFINIKHNIDFSKIKINVMNYNKRITKHLNYMSYSKKNTKFVISNIYKKQERYKKFIITFANFRAKTTFIDLMER